MASDEFDLSCLDAVDTGTVAEEQQLQQEEEAVFSNDWEEQKDYYAVFHRSRVDPILQHTAETLHCQV